MGGKKESVGLAVRDQSERGCRNDKDVGLGLNSLLDGLLVSFVPVLSQSATVGTKLTNFFCQPGSEKLVYL